MSDNCSQIMMTDFTIEEINRSNNSHRIKPKKTSFQIEQLINEMGRMLSEGKLDREIMQDLHLLYFDSIREGLVVSRPCEGS